MSQDRRRLDRQLDRVERMLERCIAADKARKRRPAESDVFYQKLEILRKMQKEVREELGLDSDASNDDPKR
jgi:hypothetical protein